MTEAQNAINVSDSWKKKFQIMEKAGVADGLKSYFDNLKLLNFGERLKVVTNILAFIFGPFYYFAKKMWLKGAFLFGVILSLNLVFTILESALGTNFPMALYQIPGAVMCGQLANYDYYRFCMKQERIWSWLPEIFSKQLVAIGFPVAAFLTLALVSVGLSGSVVPKCGDPETINLVKKIAERKYPFFSPTVSVIRTTSTSKQTGAHECAAQLDTLAGNAPITYTVGRTDDGKEVYVNVFGL